MTVDDDGIRGVVVCVALELEVFSEDSLGYSPVVRSPFIQLTICIHTTKTLVIALPLQPSDYRLILLETD